MTNDGISFLFISNYAPIYLPSSEIFYSTNASTSIDVILLIMLITSDPWYLVLFSFMGIQKTASPELHRVLWLILTNELWAEVVKSPFLTFQLGELLTFQKICVGNKHL